MYIIAYMTGRREPHHSDYETRETMAEATAFYNELLTWDNLHSASVAAVVESTDYDPPEETNTHLAAALSGIDWPLLGQQKLWLIKQDELESMGLLSLIDALQDAAVADGVATEEDVFPPTMETS